MKPRLAFVTMISVIAILGAVASADSVALTGGGTVSASGRTIISVGQPFIGLTAAPPSGLPALELGFVPASGACAADFNGVGGLNIQDIFDFLAAWFAGNPTADFNHMNGLSIQDIFDFLAAWFAGCP